MTLRSMFYGLVALVVVCMSMMSMMSTKREQVQYLEGHPSHQYAQLQQAVKAQGRRVEELEQQLEQLKRVRVTAAQQQQQHQQQDDSDYAEDLNYHLSPRLKKYTWLTDEWITDCAAELTDQCVHDADWCAPFFTKYKRYCMGDCIKACERCHRGNDTFTYPSLAHNYSSRACPRGNPLYQLGGNLDVLEAVLKDMEIYAPEKALKPPDDAIVLHLRLGDVIERSFDSIQTILTRAGDPYHTFGFEKSIKGIYEYLDNIEQSGANHIVVVGGSQFPQFYAFSRVYSKCLVRALQKTGKKVTTNFDGGDADADFYYMCHAKKFVVSSGGFSALIAKLVQRFGGQVIGRTFDETGKPKIKLPKPAEGAKNLDQIFQQLKRKANAKN